MSDFKEFYNFTKDLQRECGSVLFTRPEILHIILEDNELKEPKSLRYFKKPTPPLNLKLGFDDYKIRNEYTFRPNLNIMENFLLHNNGRDLLRQKNKQQILTSRKVLKSIMTAPYWNAMKMRWSWSILAVKFENIICLVKNTEPVEEKTLNGTYHFKFQQYCFADSPHESPNVEVPIDENKQTFCVFKNEVENFDIFYTAEIAGVKGEEEIKDFTDLEALNKCRFVSTKLLADFKGNNWKRNHKTIQWWAQALLGRVDDIYFGFKTDAGMIYREIECVPVEDMLKEKNWVPDVCKLFLRNFLEKLQRLMENVNDPYKVFEFDFSLPFEKINYRVYNVDKNQHPFLTDKLIRYMQN